MHPMKYFICILFLAIPLLSQAQLLDFKDVMRLPASVNSNVEESMPLRSPDGKTLYSANRGGRIPAKGSRVSVRGRVNEFATFGGQSVGLHLQQEHVSFKRY